MYGSLMYGMGLTVTSVTNQQVLLHKKHTYILLSAVSR